MIERPQALPVDPAGIPNTLKAERRWVLWGYVYEQRRDAWVKIPFQRDGTYAAVNRDATWCSFDEAFAAYDENRKRHRVGKYDGVGFVLGWGWAGVDLDDCFESTLGEDFHPVRRIITVAAELVAEMDCYTEISPGGDGLKLFCRSPLTGFEVRYGERTHVVPYHAGRYFAVTGQVYHGGQADVDRSEVIERYTAGMDTTAISAKVSADHDRPAWVPSSREGYEHLLTVNKISDELLIIRARMAWNGGKFNTLWEGEWRSYPSRSEADMALCCLLAYWTQCDEARMDRLFRRSGLYRRQWDRESYRRATLAKAAEMTTAVYTPEDRGSFDTSVDPNIAIRTINISKLPHRMQNYAFIPENVRRKLK